MLNELIIRNYLFVEGARFAPGKGMTAISGETGAGKSVLVGAIAMIFGASANPAEPYDPKHPVYLESVWAIDPANPLQQFLNEVGIDTENELIIARETNPEGRTSYFVNGRRSTQSVVRSIKPFLIDFHYQRDQQQLLNDDYQLRIIDLYAGHSGLVESFGSSYHLLNEQLRKLKELQEHQLKQAQMMDLYRFQADELDKANLTDGEDERWRQEFELLSKADEINELTQGLQHDLYETENSVFDQICAALSRISRYAALDPRLAELETALNQGLDALHSSADLLRRCENAIDTDPLRLDSIRQRLDLINQLKHKYRLNSIPELIQLHHRILTDIATFTDCAGAIQSLESGIDNQFHRLTALADELTASRRQAAHNLCSELERNIHLLAIPDGKIEIQIDKKTEDRFIIPDYLSRCDVSGQDSVEIRFSGNPGSVPKPLKAVVSGGELSRLLLAVKKVLAQKLHPKLMILDEIDAGIGGKTAEFMADYIHQIAACHQVLCITHLAQIAAVADDHLSIVKHSSPSQTRIEWITLDDTQRKQEIARMLSGKITEHSVKHADELLNR